MSPIPPFRHAMPVSEALFTQPLYVTHAGCETIGPDEPYWKGEDAPIYRLDDDGRILPEFGLVLIMAGGGEVEVRERRQRVAAGDAFLYLPGEWHRHRPSRETGWTAIWVNFNGEAPLRWMRERAFNLQGNIPVIENPPLFRAQFEYLIECLSREPVGNSISLSCQAIGLLSHFLSTHSSVATARATNGVKDDVVTAAVDYIWNFSHGIADVPEVACKVGLARRTLERKFKAATGRSVLEEIQFCRVSRAATLLRETAVPIKHVVHSAGFRSEEHLRLAFQKAFGKSPHAYRASVTSPPKS